MHIFVNIIRLLKSKFDKITLLSPSILDSSGSAVPSSFRLYCHYGARSVLYERRNARRYKLCAHIREGAVAFQSSYSSSSLSSSSFPSQSMKAGASLQPSQALFSRRHSPSSVRYIHNCTNILYLLEILLFYVVRGIV